jgi:hypothetical protein
LPIFEDIIMFYRSANMRARCKTLTFCIAPAFKLCPIIICFLKQRSGRVPENAGSPHIRHLPLRFFILLSVRSFTTSPAMIKPATEGTNAVEPGMSLRSVHFLAVPGGHIHCCLQLIDMSSGGLVGISLE